MNINNVIKECEDANTITKNMIDKLRYFLLEGNSEEAYDIISIAADYRIHELIPDIARHLHSSDDMTRWLATSNLFTRFISSEYAGECLALMDDSDGAVQGAAIVGAGHILAYVNDPDLQQNMAQKILNDLHDQNELTCKAAYEAILVSLGVSVMDLPKTTANFFHSRDVDNKVVEDFKKKYLSNSVNK